MQSDEPFRQNRTRFDLFFFPTFNFQKEFVSFCDNMVRLPSLKREHFRDC